MARRKFNLSELSDVEIYKLVLSGNIKRFPAGFWTEGETPVFHPEIVRYLVNVICGWVEREDIVRNISQEPFISNKLSAMMLMLYGGSPVYPIIESFPEFDFKPWEFNKAPIGFWRGEAGKINGILATKWLFEEKLKWTIDEIRDRVSTKVFKEYQLGGMLANVYGDSIWKCLDSAYPEIFVPWEIGYHMDKGFWTQENMVIATKWLFEDKLKWTKEEMLRKISASIFRDNGLGGLLRLYDNSPFEALIAAYPNLIMEFQMPTRAKGYWDAGDNTIIAIRNLIKEQLKWDRATVLAKFNEKTLFQNGYGTIATRYHPYELISIAFPEWKIMPWELKRSKLLNYWNKDTIKFAVRWMIEDKMELTKYEALKIIKRRHLSDCGLGGLLQQNLGSVKEIIEFSYADFGV